VDVIQRFAGHVAQYLGDGLLVYFGYPQAHEDDAQRAVRTGLGILEAMGTLNTQLTRDKGVRLAVRMGIHTGLVVVGEMGSGDRHEHLALGDTPNLAARLQGLAAPDTVVISAATARLVQGYFTCQDLGTQMLKGIDTPVWMYQVVGESAAQGRLDVAAASGLTPFVGREAEVTLLRERWAQSTAGLGQVMLLSGEAGIGKSRLVRVLTEEVVEAGTPRLTLRCSPYHTNSALYPVIEHLQRLLQWHRDTPPGAGLATLERVVQKTRLPLTEAVPLLAALLSLPMPERYPPLILSPQRQKQQTQEALVAWFLAEAVQQPALAVWEDLHWADPSTLELLGLLLDQVPTTRFLMVLTCRPEFRPSWAPRSYMTSLTLSRLTRQQIEEMVLRVTGGKPFPAEVVQQIVAKTDGIPLFVEELVKTVREAGLVQEAADRYVLPGPLPPLAIPATLHDALMARLDRLAGGVKEVAQLGAVLGREFSYALLRAVAPLDEATLQHGLAQLVEAELLYQRDILPQATYVFKHALVRDAAYESLLRSTRQQHHQCIAQVLEAQFPETTETQPELLAHHFTHAGLHEQAVEYWYKGGQRASARSAPREALNHLYKGLEVLTALSDTPDRTRQELRFSLALGPSLIAIHGYAAPELADYHRHTQALCQRIDDPAQHYTVLEGLLSLHLVRADLRAARELAEELLRLAQGGMPAIRLVNAHRMLGNICVHLGEFQVARVQLEQGATIAAAQLPQRSILLEAGGQDPRTSCLTWLALDLWALGYPDQARQCGEEGVTLAQQLAHPFNLGVTFNQWLRLQYLCRMLHLPLAGERAETSRRLVTEHGFVQLMANETWVQGLLLAQQGQLTEGIAQMQQGWAAYRATGANVRQPMYLAPLAEAYGQAGQVGEGLQVLAEALVYIEQAGERWWEAELHRLKGELLLLQSSDTYATAESCFYQALALARRQQAKSWELRAATSLARLWKQQGKCADAHGLLAPVYNWFTEGFDTADLQEARALLEELSA
jgi:predicted ATPase